MSTLARMFEQQAKLMEALGIDTAQSFDGFSRPAEQAAMGIASEAGEVIDVLLKPTKPWKKVPFAELREHLIEEVIDVFFFILETLILLNVGPEELALRYEEKVNSVHARILRRPK